MGLEGTVIRARALMILGMMSLDGDGVDEDEAAAFGFFERVQQVVAAGKVLIDQGSQADANAADEAHSFWVKRTGSNSLSQALLQAGNDAKECMESMDRFMYFANGRP